MVILGIVLLAGAIYALSTALGLVHVGSSAVRTRVRELSGPLVVAGHEPEVKVVTHGRGLAVAITPPMLVRAIERNFILAGQPESWSISRLLLLKPVATAFALLVSVSVFKSDPALIVKIVMIVLVLIAYFAGDLLIYNYAVKRQLEIERSLPDTLDQVTISIEAGLGFEAALANAARNGTGPLAEELVRLMQDMNLGMSRRDAYTALGDRTTVPDLRRFTKSIVQAEENGVPISGVVRSQAKEMRIRRRTRAEAKAQQVPVKILIPLMLLILPVLFIIVLGPAITNAYA
jgi:tight adherence protein C